MLEQAAVTFNRIPAGKIFVSGGLYAQRHPLTVASINLDLSERRFGVQILRSHTGGKFTARVSSIIIHRTTRQPLSFPLLLRFVLYLSDPLTSPPSPPSVSQDFAIYYIESENNNNRFSRVESIHPCLWNVNAWRRILENSNLSTRCKRFRNRLT